MGSVGPGAGPEEAGADDVPHHFLFDGWCGFLNYFDSALPFQLSFINHRSRGGFGFGRAWGRAGGSGRG